MTRFLRAFGLAWLLVVLFVGPAAAQYGAYPTAPNTSAPNYAKTMHIATTGNDTGALGTVSSPFKTGQAAMNACGTTPCVLQFDAGQTPGALIINPANPYVAVRGVGAASQISSLDNTTPTVYDHPNNALFAVREYSDISVMSNNFSYTGISFDNAGSGNTAYYMMNIANLTGGGTPSGASNATFQCINDVNVFASDLGNTTFNEINYARVKGNNFGAINSVGNVTVRYDTTQTCLPVGATSQGHFDYYHNRNAGDITLSGTPNFLAVGNVAHAFTATSLAVAGTVQPNIAFEQGQLNGAVLVTFPSATGSGGSVIFDDTTFYNAAPTLAIASGSTRMPMSFNGAKLLAGTFVIGDFVDVTASGANIVAAVSTTGGANTGTLTQNLYSLGVRSPSGNPLTLTSGATDSGTATGMVFNTANAFNTSGDIAYLFETGGSTMFQVDNYSGNGRRILLGSGYPSGFPAGYVQHPSYIQVGLSGGGAFLEIQSTASKIMNGSVGVENNAGNWRPSTDKGSYLGDATHRWKRTFKGGTVATSGAYSVGSGWGSTASVGTFGGSDSQGSVVVTSAGTGQAASPTLTYSFVDGTWTNAPTCTGKIQNTTDTITQADHALLATSTSATAVTWTWTGTPVATKTYTLVWRCDGN